jgi:transcriptional regulator NrdR family protein
MKTKKQKYEKRYCPKCSKQLTQMKEYVSDGYSYACLNCDEDFYTFETLSKEYLKIKKQKNKSTIKRILENQKTKK